MHPKPKVAPALGFGSLASGNLSRGHDPEPRGRCGIIGGGGQKKSRITHRFMLQASARDAATDTDARGSWAGRQAAGLGRGLLLCTVGTGARLLGVKGPQAASAQAW